MATVSISQMDMPIIDQVFEMESGFCLDFSNRTFEDFFRTELQIAIYHSKYETFGTSKAKRLRALLLQTTPLQAAKILTKLWEYRVVSKLKDDDDPLPYRVKMAFFNIITRLGGDVPEEVPEPASPTIKKPEVSPSVIAELTNELMSISTMDPQPRGYAFEKFLNKLFGSYSLKPRKSFRLIGEQIDGSFDCNGHTYLLEAKWTNKQADASVLLSFNGKVTNKASWSRGLVVSYSGFSEDGLEAFGKGKSVICMDGLDIHDLLSRSLDFEEVIIQKSRTAAESGNPFVRVRDLNI